MDNKSQPEVPVNEPDAQEEGQVPDPPLSLLLDFEAFRLAKEEGEALTRGRRPLYVSHVSSVLQDKFVQSKLDFSARVSRLRQGVDKVSAMVADLQRLGPSGCGEVD